MKDIIKDTDTHFIIDGSTRLVKNDTDTKSMLVQYDHNSERFTFRIPRKVDNHDLSQCNYVRVHFINIDKSKRTENHGIDDITDTLEVCPEDDGYVICSWLIARDATQLAGSLHFVIQFAVKEGDTIKYSWNTAKYTGITIQDGINFDEQTISENNDLLTQWENRLKASQIMKAEQTTVSDVSGGENVWTVTFGDGTTSELRVKNGSRGHVGSVETIDGHTLQFFVGTEDEYDALPNKENLFAITTDGITKDAVRGNGTGFTYQYKTNYNANAFVTEGHYFLIKGYNVPYEHGFLDVDYFNGDDFAPDANKGKTYCIKQTFRPYNSDRIYVRSGKRYEEESNFTFDSWVDLNYYAHQLNGEWITLADTAGYVVFSDTVGGLEKATYLVAWEYGNYTHSAIANMTATNMGARITWVRSKTTVGYIELDTRKVYAYYYQGDSAATDDTITNVRVKRIM